jgi:hypothetical protein
MDAIRVKEEAKLKRHELQRAASSNENKMSDGGR